MVAQYLITVTRADNEPVEFLQNQDLRALLLERVVVKGAAPTHTPAQIALVVNEALDEIIQVLKPEIA